MKIEHRVVSVQDTRGIIRDVLKQTPIDNATLITAKAGSVRGNHYHLIATVYVFVLSGKLQAFSRIDDNVSKITVIPNDLITFLPRDLHALVALEDSSFMLLANGPRGGEFTVQETLV